MADRGRKRFTAGEVLKAIFENYYCGYLGALPPRVEAIILKTSNSSSRNQPHGGESRNLSTSG